MANRNNEIWIIKYMRNNIHSQYSHRSTMWNFPFDFFKLWIHFLLFSSHIYFPHNFFFFLFSFYFIYFVAAAKKAKETFTSSEPSVRFKSGVPHHSVDLSASCPRCLAAAAEKPNGSDGECSSVCTWEAFAMYCTYCVTCVYPSIECHLFLCDGTEVTWSISITTVTSYVLTLRLI